MSVGKIITWKGKQYHLPFNIEAVGKHIKWGKGTESLGMKIKILKSEGGEEYQVVGNFIHPCKGVERVDGELELDPPQDFSTPARRRRVISPIQVRAES